jgi:hypothetical protein
MKKGIWNYKEDEELELGDRVAGHTAFETGCFTSDQLSVWLKFTLTARQMVEGTI